MPSFEHVTVAVRLVPDAEEIAVVEQEAVPESWTKSAKANPEIDSENCSEYVRVRDAEVAPLGVTITVGMTESTSTEDADDAVAGAALIPSVTAPDASVITTVPSLEQTTVKTNELPVDAETEVVEHVAVPEVCEKSLAVIPETISVKST